MNGIRYEVELRRPSKPGKIKAFADVLVRFSDGTIKLIGCSVIQVDGKPPFVGLPSKSGNTPGKFFPVVEVEGAIRVELFKAVLDAYANMGDGE